MKEAHKKVSRGLSKIFINILWLIIICLKYFMTPANSSGYTPRYFMYRP